MEQTIEKIKQKALQEHIPIIKDTALDKIKEILLKNKPKTILEIGTAVGYSAICFYNILKNVSIDTYIDTMEIDEQRVKEAKQNIEKLKLESNINVILGNALEILPTINKKYDIVFIDSVKSKYPIFLEHSLRLTQKGSIIIADNILYNGYVLSDYNKHKQRTAVNNLRKYIELVTNKENKNLDTQILDIGDGLAVTYIIK